MIEDNPNVFTSSFEELYIDGDIKLIKSMPFGPINFKKVFLPQSSIYPIAHSAPPHNTPCSQQG